MCLRVFISHMKDIRALTTGIIGRLNELIHISYWEQCLAHHELLWLTPCPTLALWEKWPGIMGNGMGAGDSCTSLSPWTWHLVDCLLFSLLYHFSSTTFKLFSFLALCLFLFPNIKYCKHPKLWKIMYWAPEAYSQMWQMFTLCFSPLFKAWTWCKTG